LPTLVHSARQEEASEKGKLAAHDVQSELRGPEHVAHELAHLTHVSDELSLPPEHVQPASMSRLPSPVHAELQPSSSTRLPSSQYSLPTRRPSPQTVAQLLGAERLPPVQT